MSCGDCGLDKPIMVGMRSPKGDWWLCVGCYTTSIREAEADRKALEAKLAEQEKRQRQNHNRERVGSH